MSSNSISADDRGDDGSTITNKNSNDNLDDLQIASNKEELVLPPEVWASVMECTYQYIIEHFTCVPRLSYLTLCCILFFTSTFLFWYNCLDKQISRLIVCYAGLHAVQFYTMPCHFLLNYI